MIEQALGEHLASQECLMPFLATYGGEPAIFSQKAPADADCLWGDGPQYGRIVYDIDLQGDPARTMGGLLSVDILCKGDEQFPEDIEPILRPLIHGYFFSNGTFTVSAQWKNSAYFTEATDAVTGCTVTFDLLAFPISNYAPNVIAQFNEWSSTIENLHVINHDPLPKTAWKPCGGESAVYWRAPREAPADLTTGNYSTQFFTATVKGYIFAESPAVANEVANDLKVRLYEMKRLKKDGQLLRAVESPIIVNRRNTVDNDADPLRVGQLTVEATYGVVIHHESGETIQHINYGKETTMASTKEKPVPEAAKAAPIANTKVSESVYSAKELAENYKLFNTSFEIVTIALRLAGKKEATFSEAKKIIEEFKNKEVK